MAKTEIALSRIITPNIWSGTGCCGDERCGFSPKQQRSMRPMPRLHLGKRRHGRNRLRKLSKRLGEFIGLTLSDICYSRVKETAISN